MSIAQQNFDEIGYTEIQVWTGTLDDGVQFVPEGFEPNPDYVLIGTIRATRLHSGQVKLRFHDTNGEPAQPDVSIAICVAFAEQVAS